MKNKKDAEILRETKPFDDAMQNGKMSWQKSKNKMTHLKPKKKKRK